MNADDTDILLGSRTIPYLL